jgi:NAD(P)-dependent dehydrogenase (short-subunit alcohol dehydrogenase family)
MRASVQLAGGVAVITGAGSGIGEGLAQEAARLGMRVVLADISAERIERVAGAIRDAGGEALAIPTDVTDAAAMVALARSTHERFGDVRLLINNAGIEAVGYIWDIEPAVWERAFRVNVLGVVHGLRAFVPAMCQSKQPAYIANVSSVGGLGMMAQQAPYIASKHAVLSLTESLALELQLVAPHLRVSVVLPGPVMTRIFEDAPIGQDAASVAHHMRVMKDMLAQHGMPAKQAASIMLERIAAGDFWVSTHPAITEQMARARAEHLQQLARPTMTAEAVAILGPQSI